MNAYALTRHEQDIHFGQQDARDIPVNIEAEQALLGAIMVNNDVLAVVKAPIEAAHFFDQLHRKIFQAMIDLRAEGKRINPISVKSSIPADTKVGNLSGAQYLARLAAEATSVVNANDFAEIIIDAAVARATMNDADLLLHTASTCWSELQFLDKVKELADKVRHRVQEARAKEHRRPGDAYMDSFEAASQNAGAVGVPISLPEIRRVLNEDVFEAGNLYGLLSSSGEGKTSITVQMILSAIKAGHPTMFLSYDQSAAQCVRQMVAQEHGIDAKQQRDPNGSMSEWERDKCVLFSTWLNDKPLDIVRCRREGVSRLISYANRFVQSQKTDKTPLIVIDHIGKVKPRDDRMSPDKISGEITVELKAFADETQSAVVILNQRNSEGTRRDNPRPISRDIYGGEGAKADYDAIMYLYRPAKYRNDMLATASDERARGKIAAVFSEFGDKIDTVAEVGSIKVRFGDPSVREWLKFEARYTRYISPDVESQPQGRML